MPNRGHILNIFNLLLLVFITFKFAKESNRNVHTLSINKEKGILS